MAIWLALLLLFGLPQVASAITLQVTGGELYSTPEFDDSCPSFGGVAFSVGGCSGPVNTVNYGRLTPEGDRVLVTTWSFDMRGAGFRASVGALQCYTEDYDETCGELTLIHGAPVVLPADWDFAIPFVATVPFTLTGFLVFEGGERFDLMGQGLFTWEHQQRWWPPHVGRYAFLPPTTVPEPATWLLLLPALGLMSLARRRWVA